MVCEGAVEQQRDHGHLLWMPRCVVGTRNSITSGVRKAPIQDSSEMLDAVREVRKIPSPPAPRVGPISRSPSRRTKRREPAIATDALHGRFGCGGGLAKSERSLDPGADDSKCRHSSGQALRPNASNSLNWTGQQVVRRNLNIQQPLRIGPGLLLALRIS